MSSYWDWEVHIIILTWPYRNYYTSVHQLWFSQTWFDRISKVITAHKLLHLSNVSIMHTSTDGSARKKIQICDFNWLSGTVILWCHVGGCIGLPIFVPISFLSNTYGAQLLHGRRIYKNNALGVSYKSQWFECGICTPVFISSMCFCPLVKVILVYCVEL